MLPGSLRFVWGNPPVPGARWRFGVFNLTRPPRTNRDLRRRLERSTDPEDDDSVLRISLRGALGWSAGLAFAAYLAGAAFIVVQLDARSPHNRIGYLDLVLPDRWAGLDRLRGEAMLAEGKEKLDSGDFREGLSLLRAGLSRVPDDHDARLLLVRVYLRVNVVANAVDILVDGLSHGYPGIEYLETLRHMLLESGRQAELPDLLLRAWSLRPAEEKEEAARDDTDPLATMLAESLLLNRRAAEAVAFVTENLPAGHSLRRQVEIMAPRAAGDLISAKRLAEQWEQEDANATEPLLQLIAICAEQGDHAGLDRALGRRKALDPTSPEPWIESVVRKFAAGRADDAERELDELVWRHGSHARVYDQAARAFADAGFEPGLERLRREANLRGLSDRMVLWGMVVDAEKKGDWPRVLAGLEEIAARDEPTPPEQKERIATLRLLALNCTEGGTGHAVALIESIAGRTLKLTSYLQIFDALLASGHIDTAREVLVLSEGPFPAAAPLVGRRALLAEAEARRPVSPPPASPHAPHLESPAAFEAAFTGHLDKNNPSAALALIDLARRENPSWFQNESARMDRLELPLRVRDDDPLRLQVLLRSVLIRETTPTEILLALARSIHPSHPENARLILDEILRRHPKDVETLDTRDALFPPPAAPAGESA